MASFYYIQTPHDGRYHAFEWSGISLCSEYRAQGKQILRDAPNVCPRGVSYCVTCKRAAKRIAKNLKSLERRNAHQPR